MKREVLKVAICASDREYQTRLREYCENYLRERNTGFYASKLCISPKYLSSIIKEQSGKTCADWIDEYISFNARTLLKDSTLSIKQISDRLGFPSQSVFGRFFKKVNGVSPKVFRNQQDL